MIDWQLHTRISVQPQSQEQSASIIALLTDLPLIQILLTVMLDDGNAKRPSESVQDDSGSAADASVSKPALSDDLSHVSTSETNAPTPQSESRAELVEKARLFLISPQIRHEDIAAKRRFLAEKGLSDAEIDGLLQELVNISCQMKGRPAQTVYSRYKHPRSLLELTPNPRLPTCPTF